MSSSNPDDLLSPLDRARHVPLTLPGETPGASQAPGHHPGPSSETPGARRLRLLLVEDNDDDALLLERMLEKLPSVSYEVTRSGRLAEALEVLSDPVQGFDIALVDLALPDSSGLDSVNRVQEAAPDLPVIVLSGLNNEALAFDAVQQGVQDYLVKGQITVFMLERSIRFAIERKRQQVEVQLDISALHAEHERLAGLIESVDVSIVLLDAGGHIVLVNDSWIERNHIPRESALGRRFDEIGEYPVAPEVQSTVDRVLVTGEPVRFREWFYRDYNHPNGIYVDGSILPIKDNAGNIIGARAVSIDVTDKVRARASVEEERVLLDLVIANTPVGISVLDRDLRFVRLNGEYAALAGIDRHTSVGKSLYDLIPSARTRAASHQAALRGESIDQYTVPFRAPGSSSFLYLDVRYRPIRDAGGDVAGLLVTVADVTERVNAHRRVESQRALLEALIDAVPVGLACFDRDMRVLAMNAAYAAMGPVDPATARGRRLYDLFPVSEERRALHERVLKGEAIDLHDVSYHNPVDNTEHFFDIYLRPVQEISGETGGIVSAVVETTEHYELERHKENFLTLTSHELRTPLTSIRGYAELALRRARTMGDERLSRSLSIIKSQSEHLSRMVNDLLDVSRISGGVLPLHLTEFDLSELLASVVADTRVAEPEADLTLNLPNKQAPVRADRSLIEEVVVNLLDNSLKYVRDTAKVEVSLEVAGDNAVVTVRDNGLGVPEDQRELVFERFYRATNTGTRVRNGLGLGLFIARSIVERHGGTLLLEPASEEGSTFRFRLPLLRAGA